jgi:hypothetical protein
MAEVIYVTCPRCRRKFCIGPEFFTISESYCHCPYCGNEFSVYPKHERASFIEPGPS